MDRPRTLNFQTIDNPVDPTFNNLMGINNSGLIAGFYGSGDAGHPNQGYLLRPPGGFTAVDFPGEAQTQLTGLNDRGVQVGYFYPTNNGVPVDNQFGFYVKDGAFVSVNNPKTPTNPDPGVLIENQLMGVNDRDIAVGFYNDASGNSHGYTYDIKTGTFSADINDPSAVSTVSAAINDRGGVAGFYTDASGAVHGFLERDGHFKTVDAPGATTTELLGLNDRGEAVGEDVVGGVTHGLIYDARTGVFTNVDAPNSAGFTLFNGLNDKGDIVGFYTDAAGNTHGLLATPDHHGSHLFGGLI
jgi:nitrite reductase/ring-hydroxylating ferredoxin subunit